VRDDLLELFCRCWPSPLQDMYAGIQRKVEAALPNLFNPAVTDFG
jgi:hypothetical protein